MVYHLLPELEQFCPDRGGALSKIVANLMRFDDSRAVVCCACPSHWGYEPERIIVIPELLAYGNVKGRRFAPSQFNSVLFRKIFKPLLSQLQVGDMVWCHNQPYIAAALVDAIHAAGAKLIYQAHDPRARCTEQRALRSFTADAWAFDSEALRQRYLTLFPSWKRSFVLHNGADEGTFYPAPRGPQQNPIPVILFVGRLQAEKGVHVLLDAIRILQRRSVDVVCRLIGSHFSGSGKRTAYIRSLYRSRPPNVEFVGYRTPAEVGQEFRKADIFCCPSIWLEAFGMVNVEAMACQVPVVASRVGGIPEIASEGGMLLVEPGSTIDLADALQQLLENPALREKIGAEGLRSFRRRFAWPTVARQYLSHLEHVQ